MSTKNEFISISPSPLMRAPEKEVFISKGHTCPYCKGNGWFWTEDEKTGESTKINCPLCKGSKKVEAYITIEWRVE